MVVGLRFFAGLGWQTKHPRPKPGAFRVAQFLVMVMAVTMPVIIVVVADFLDDRCFGVQPRPVPPYRCKHSRSWPLASGEELP